MRAGTRVPRKHRPHHGSGEKHEDDATEHLFALEHEHLFGVKLLREA